MQRDTYLYKLRRKCQCLATKVCGYSAMTKFYYRILLHEKCNLKNPQNMNEKICWLKLNKFVNDELVIKCADKFLVREYVKETIGEQYLVPLLGNWNKAEEIDFSKLPKKFILKCNHGCAYNILVDDKLVVDTKKIKLQLNNWLKEDFSLFNAEPHYKNIPKKIICEKHLGKNLKDYKFFCFNGKVEFYYISEGLLDDRTAKMCHYLRNGEVAPYQRESYTQYNFELPEKINEMVDLAEKLSKAFAFVRVDFIMDKNDDLYFSELTFTPGGGYNELSPKKYLDELGKKIEIK